MKGQVRSKKFPCGNLPFLTHTYNVFDRLVLFMFMYMYISEKLAGNYLAIRTVPQTSLFVSSSCLPPQALANTRYYRWFSRKLCSSQIITTGPGTKQKEGIRQLWGLMRTFCM